MAKNKIIVQGKNGEQRIVQPSVIPPGFEKVRVYKESEKDFSKLSVSQLQNIKNDDLQAYLDEIEVEYQSNATKEDLINLIVGE